MYLESTTVKLPKLSNPEILLCELIEKFTMQFYCKDSFQYNCNDAVLIKMTVERPWNNYWNDVLPNPNQIKQNIIKFISHFLVGEKIGRCRTVTSCRQFLDETLIVKKFLYKLHKVQTFNFLLHSPLNSKFHVFSSWIRVSPGSEGKRSWRIPDVVYYTKTAQREDVNTNKNNIHYYIPNVLWLQ